MRTSRNTGISLGPVALLIIGPVILAAWVVYIAVMTVYGLGLIVVRLGKLAVEGIEAAWQRIEHRQEQRWQRWQRDA